MPRNGGLAVNPARSLDTASSSGPFVSVEAVLTFDITRGIKSKVTDKMRMADTTALSELASEE